MKTLKTVAEMKEYRRTLPGSVGFVPTMGALHAGHMTLIERAKERDGVVIASIFVNPTQFNNPDDLARYPRTLERDLRVLEAAAIDAVFLPSTDEMYADQFRFRVEETRDSQVLCGPTRPGHFDGVLTVVLKLFHLVQPRRAYFGEKDFQQLKLISDMVAALFLDVEIVPVPTVREKDGLAMSSRNARLDENARAKAALIYRALTRAKNAEEARRELEGAGFDVDYVEDRWNRRFAAASLDGVRLIDNVEL